MAFVPVAAAASPRSDFRAHMIVQIFRGDDCMDAGGRATHGAVAEAVSPTIKTSLNLTAITPYNL
jgi:hypothetical protein